MGAIGRPSKTFEKTFYRLWWITISTFGLTPTEALLMFLVDSLSKNRGWCYASKKTLADLLNVTEPTIYNAQKKLIDKGLLLKSIEPDGDTVSWKPANQLIAWAQSHGRKITYLTPSEKWKSLISSLSGGYCP